MNKYQEALDNIKKAPSFMGGNVKYNSNIQSSIPFLEDIAILQELVNKEKPMKAIIYNTNQFLCPSCKKQIKGQKMIYNDATKKFDIKSSIKVEKIYCPYCRQRLDWSKENE